MFHFFVYIECFPSSSSSSSSSTCGNWVCVNNRKRNITIYNQSKGKRRTKTRDSFLWLLVLPTSFTFFLLLLHLFSFFCLHVCVMMDGRLPFFSIPQQRKPYHTQNPPREKFFRFFYIYLFFFLLFSFFNKSGISVCVC